MSILNYLFFYRSWVYYILLNNKQSNMTLITNKKAKITLYKDNHTLL